ncbi:queuosine precursor transporter [Terrilactibacillus sp. S3-3]|nr:queuosine precursor transporter [Terrilactibacillus sp. S3-3]
MKSDNQIIMPFKLITLAMIYMTCLIAANLGAVKLFSLGSLSMTSGIIMYPLTFLILDSTAEVWGKHVARRIVWIGLAANLLFILLMQAVIHLPPAPGWREQSAYAAILGAMPRIVFASLSGYLVSQTLDVTLFVTQTKKDKRKKKNYGCAAF